MDAILVEFAAAHITMLSRTITWQQILQFLSFDGL